jgi:TRAP-type C4-dicarboxylate transport system permease small subunit
MTGEEQVERALAGMRRLSQWGLWFGGALVLLAALLIGIDVLLRKFFTRSIGGADELAGYALAIGSAWGLAAALVDRAHIRIDSLYIWFPSYLRAALDLTGLALFIGFFALVAWHGSGVVAQSWTSGSRSQSDLQTPTILPQVLWIAGIILFVFGGLLLILEALVKLKAGDQAGIARLIGTRSAEEEVEEEIRALEQRQVDGGRA